MQSPKSFELLRSPVRITPAILGKGNKRECGMEGLRTLSPSVRSLSLYNWLSSYKILQPVAGKSVLMSVKAVVQVMNSVLTSVCSSQ